jgi:YqbF-like protein
MYATLIKGKDYTVGNKTFIRDRKVQIDEAMYEYLKDNEFFNFEVEENKGYTKAKLKAIKKEQQEEILTSLQLDPADYSNENERIEAILEAQAGE